MTNDSLFLTSAFSLIDLIKHPNNECIFNAYFFFLMIWVVRYEAEFSFCYLNVIHITYICYVILGQLYGILDHFDHKTVSS